MSNKPHFNHLLANLADEAKAWPFVEAKNLIKRLESKPDNTGKEVIF